MRQLATIVAFGLVLCLLGGCASLPPGRAAVDDIDFEGNENVDSDDIEEKLSTRESPRFMGLFQGVMFDYQVFNRFVLERDLMRVERYYHSRGFYKAHVRASRIFYDGPDHVRVQVKVSEGPPTSLRRLDFHGLERLSPKLRALAEQAARNELDVGERFDEEAFERAEKALRRTLQNHAHAYATVKRTAQVDLPRNFAVARFDVEPYIPARYGKVTIRGLGKLPEDEVRTALDLTPGDAYSQDELDDAEQAVLDLGVFSSVKIEPQLEEPPPDDPVVPIVVELQPTDLHAVKLGGGVQLDAIRADAHLLAGWEHRNLFGGLRHFTIEFRPGLVFYPTRFPSFQAPTDYLPEGRLTTQLRQPGFIEARTNGFLRGEFTLYPVLLSPDVNPDAPILGYREAKGTVGVDRRIWRFFGRPSYNIQQSTPFTYRGVLDPDLEPLLISFGEIFSSLDFRDDKVEPHKGVYLSNELQFAGGPFGGQVRDLRVKPELRVFVPLGKRLTLAARGTTGLLFPMNYGDTLGSADGRPPDGVDRGQWVRDVQIGFFRSFFSGGPSSNRGYPLRGIGPHGVVPFFDPGLQAQALSDSCLPDDPAYSTSRCAQPLGGRSLWEASLELRFPISGPLTGASFCDSGDVAPGEVSYRFDRLHLSCGLGARYATPVGPIRLDLGYRIPGLQTLGDDTGEGVPPTIFGVPLAVAIGIGEPF